MPPQQRAEKPMSGDQKWDRFFSVNTLPGVIPGLM